jgi:tetratricopeptide (TPR) repeat protein
LQGAEQQTWLARLEADHDNLRAALGWARERAADAATVNQGLRLAGMLWRFWFWQGYVSEGRAWLAALLAVAGAADPLTHVSALNAAGILANIQGDPVAAQTLLQEALTHGRKLGDRRSIALSLSSLGLVAAVQGNAARAQTLLEESLTLQRELGDRAGIASILNSLGAVAAQRGDYATARPLCEEALALFRALGDRVNRARPLFNLGYLARVRGDYATARALSEEALTVLRILGTPNGIADGLLEVGKMAHLQGEYATAQTYYAESLSLLQDLGVPRYTLIALLGLGAVLVAQAGDQLVLLTRATQVLGAATALLEQISASLTAEEQPPHVEQALAMARAELGEAAFVAAWAAGQRLTLEQAIALALDPADE